MMSSEQRASPISKSPLPRPLQFSLRHLLLATLIVAFASALVFRWGPIGFLLSFMAACVLAMCWGAYRGSWEFFLGGLFAIPLCLCAFPISHGPEPSRRMQCGNHLKQIAIALHNYHDIYGSLPPAYVTDATGKPVHSWRVLLLPFCEGKLIYDRYNFNEPWDGPNNGKLAGEMPACFCCPSRSDKQPATETSYVVVVGPQTMWPGANPISLSAVTDGTSNTIMVVEVQNSAIHWMEPRDLHVTQMPMAINPPRGQGISSAHPNVVIAAYADGHTQALTNNTPPEILRALLTIAGGETIGNY